jgi:hypothetical protein
MEEYHMSCQKSVPFLLGLVTASLGFAIAAQADYVIPMMGGDQAEASMIHTDVMFDGTNIMLDYQLYDNPLPTLRPLVPPDEFDPAAPWSVLQDKAYNFQYAWNPGGFITLPPGTAIWVEQLSHDSVLEAYLRPPSAPAWSAVFTTDGERWKWSGAMAHNAYAVLHPKQTQYQATYKVYIGDATTGDPVPGYGSSTVTWTWQVDLCQTHVVWADADDDGDVDQDDFGVFQVCMGNTAPYPPEMQWCRCFDRNGNGTVDAADVDEFSKCDAGPNVLWSFSLTPQCAP